MLKTYGIVSGLAPKGAVTMKSALLSAAANKGLQVEVVMDVEGRTRTRYREGHMPHSFFRTGIAGGRRYPAADSCDRQGEEVESGIGHRRYGL